jgi:uncharacterized protein (DUF2235 family)
MDKTIVGKRIVICSDGTGNTANKGRGTNVFKLFEAVDLNGHRTKPDLTPQIALYDDGVGTQNFKLLKIFAGVTGFGLSRNVRQLYKELVRIYDPGNHIFLFGFSRGAFTVRTLAGLIANCGILDARKLETSKKLEKAVRKIYKVYRKRYRTELAKLIFGDPDTSKIAQFRRKHCLEDETHITFLGVWDTVDAVGTPFHISDFVNMTLRRFKFPDNELNDKVDRACHALAIDDQRDSFHPLVWDEKGDEGRIRQVWFSGAHSNIGGGYPKQGMSLVALDWMLTQAEEVGLRTLGTDRAFYRDHANVDDKLYDPRAGLGVFYRWKPRDIAEICRENNIKPSVHVSVLERIAHGTDDYAPGNLPSDAGVVITPTGDREKDAAACERARELESVIRHAHNGNGSLLSGLKRQVLFGRASYYLYVTAAFGALLAISVPVPFSLRPWETLKNAGAFVGNALTLQFGDLIARFTELSKSPEHIGIASVLLVVSVVAYLFGRKARVEMSASFSEFWHREQLRLREALKRARKTAIAKSGAWPREAVVETEARAAK